MKNLSRREQSLTGGYTEACACHATDIVGTHTITPRKIASDETTMKIEAVHYQKVGNAAAVPVEKSSKSGKGPVNEKDFEGF